MLSHNPFLGKIFIIQTLRRNRIFTHNGCIEFVTLCTDRNDLFIDRQSHNPHTDFDDPCVDCCDPRTDRDRVAICVWIAVYENILNSCNIEYIINDLNQCFMNRATIS